MKFSSYTSQLIILFLVFFSYQSGFTKTETEPIVIGQKIKISSKALGEERPIMIYLPPGYEQSDAKYPVLYMLDGETHFHHGSGIAQFLAANGRIPQMIIVAIPNTERGRDFTPTITEQIPGSGGANIFLSFLQNELIPLIENSFRTQPYRILFGHSLTGMFSVYTMVKRPYLFQSFIAASPYLQYDDEAVVKKAAKVLTAESVQNKSFYLTIGDEPAYEPARAHFIELLESLTGSGLNWKFPKMPEANHGSVVHITLYQGLEFVFSGWQYPLKDTTDVASIDEHFSKLSARYNYKIQPPEFLLNRLGYQLLGKEQYDDAVNVFRRNVTLYPKSSNVYDSLGETFEKSGDLKLAEENYAIAVEKGEKANSRNLAVYKTNLERVKALLK